MSDPMVAVRGGGDLGTGVALRLWRCGFRVVVLEKQNPVAVRRTVAISEAVYDGVVSVEGIRGVRADDPDAAARIAGQDEIPVLIDPAGDTLDVLSPAALVDAILAKRNTGTTSDMASVVIGLGPGFEAGRDVHAVVETNRGPDLGRVIWCGFAAPNTGEPGPVQGRTTSRVLRAPRSGEVRALHAIGDIVEEGEIVAEIGGEPVIARFSGVLRGLVRDGISVPAGIKVGDVDPRLDPSICFRVSDKALAVAGGVVEAILASLHGRVGRP